MFGIPENVSPDFLKDEQRLNVLFAPLRNRSVNPKDWDNKVASWKTLIKLYCLSNNVYSFTLSSLNTIFVRNGRPPSCMNVVIVEMLTSGDLQLVDDFLKRSELSWKGWVTDMFIRRPWHWSLTKIRNSVLARQDVEQNYVHLGVIQSKANDLLLQFPSKYHNKLISINVLMPFVENISSDTNNIKLLLHYLMTQQKADIANNLVINNEGHQRGNEESNEFLIKLTDGVKVKRISDVDIGIYNLETNEAVLLKHLELLEDDVQRCIKEAKVHLSKGHRQLAKNSLRKRNEIERRISKKGNALHNVNILLERIRDTHSDAHVWESYKQALSTFNSIYNDTGLTEDAIEDTMIKVGDMLDLHDDIQTSLARGPPDNSSNDANLEEELAQLLKDDINQRVDDIEEDLTKLDLNLPDVPVSIINNSVNPELTLL